LSVVVKIRYYVKEKLKTNDVDLICKNIFDCLDLAELAKNK